MSDKRCPHCNRWNSGVALVCDCGFNFSTHTLSEVPVSDNPSLSSSWRVGLIILGIALVPGFFLVGFLATNLGQFAPLLVVILLTILVLSPTYWLLYFTRLEKTWARYFMLITGLACVVLEVFVVASFVLRMIYPQ